ncbi:MBL fold metallo-hydrolase [Candidatus Bathyarchaeota archaeon]|nr:MBL fold metallo-hydrolase [Candidatus Bathyarchaeota archaeon]
MVKVMEGVYSMDHSEAGDHSLETWALDCGEGVVLVDGGMRENAVTNIGEELKAMGRTWRDVKLILVTHKHGDHVKNLPRLVELTGAPVKSQMLEAPLIKAAAGVDIGGLSDREVLPICGGIEVVHVPGHSEGNACYYLRKQRALIAGDTVFGDAEGNITPPPERYCLDVAQATRGIKRLLEYDFDALLYTHGKDVLKGGKTRVKELVEKHR